MRGAGLWARSFAYFSFNYGFGMGLILDGKPYFGSHRNAGEMRMFRPDDETENRPALRYLIDELRRNGVRIDSVADLKERFDPAWARCRGLGRAHHAAARSCRERGDRRGRS